MTETALAALVGMPRPYLNAIASGHKNCPCFDCSEYSDLKPLNI